MLKVNNISVKYGNITIVDRLSFSVEEGQWLMIAGPNGAGKSTVLNAITQGVPYTGDIEVMGKNVRSIRPSERARLIGFLAQNHYVGYEFSVEEVVRLGRYSHSPKFFSGKKDSDDEAVEEALKLTGLESIRGQSVMTLSGGELQRTFLAQVFAQDPKILLLDEPTNHLDLQYQKQVFALVSDWVKKPGRAVVSVVHDLSLAKAFGTDALLMNKGKAIAGGDVKTVLSPENLNSVYEMDVRKWMVTILRQWE